MPHHEIGKFQRFRAKQLRRMMTRAETLLWRHLKAHRLAALGFRRQSPIGNYIADFVAHSRKLVVEVDGESHDFEERLRHDDRRDRWFASQGYRVLRFTNFKTSNGPDVHIYMVAAEDARDNASVEHAAFVDLGLIKGNIGDQNYTLGSDLDLAKYRTVSVWCKQFSKNFGAAPLMPAALSTR